MKERAEMLKGKRVFVAMSGGVDSSVVAGLMAEEGCEVVGVTMCFSLSHPQSRKPSCCGVEGIDDARKSAQILGVDHYVLDFAADIQDFIIDDFIGEYLSGRTPNPCVRCNQHLKFGSLYKKVMGMGADLLATGHYARLEYDPRFKERVMRKAVDERKDQSYFLYSMKRDVLAHVLFPLGGMRKDQVRSLAQRYGLPTADKPESQDICFVPEGGYQQFLAERLGEKVRRPGLFLDHEGRVVGEHKGIAFYTIGQREKLGLALGYPAYVFKINKSANTVTVGPKECLYSRGLRAAGFNPLVRLYEQGVHEVSLRLRYRAPEVKGTLTVRDHGRIQVDFHEPQMAVTPGQSVVFYDDDVVLGGAVIEAALPLIESRCL